MFGVAPRPSRGSSPGALRVRVQVSGSLSSPASHVCWSGQVHVTLSVRDRAAACGTRAARVLILSREFLVYALVGLVLQIRAGWVPQSRMSKTEVPVAPSRHCPVGLDQHLLLRPCCLCFSFPAFVLSRNASTLTSEAHRFLPVHCWSECLCSLAPPDDLLVPVSALASLSFAFWHACYSGSVRTLVMFLFRTVSWLWDPSLTSPGPEWPGHAAGLGFVPVVLPSHPGHGQLRYLVNESYPAPCLKLQLIRLLLTLSSLLSLFVELPLADVEMNETLVRVQSFDSLVLKGKVLNNLFFFTRMEILKL